MGRLIAFFFLTLTTLPPAHIGQGAPGNARSESVVFKSGAIDLHGTVYLPKGPGPHAAMVVLHASGGGERTYQAYKHLIGLLPDRGIAVLVFDRRGSGESGGDFQTATFADLADVDPVATASGSDFR